MLGKLFSRSSSSNRRSRKGISAGVSAEVGAYDDSNTKAKAGYNGEIKGKGNQNDEDQRSKSDEMATGYSNGSYDADQTDHHQDIHTKNLLYGTLNKSNMPLLNSDNDIRVLILQNKENTNQFLFDSLSSKVEILPEGKTLGGQFHSVLSHQDIKSVVFGTSLQSKLMGTQTKYHCIPDSNGKVTKVIVAKVFKLIPAPITPTTTDGDLSYIQINDASSISFTSPSCMENYTKNSNIIWKQKSTVDSPITSINTKTTPSSTPKTPKASIGLNIPNSSSHNLNIDNDASSTAHIAIGIAIVIHLPQNDPNVILNHWNEFSSCLIDLQFSVYQKLSSCLVVKTSSGLSSLLSAPSAISEVSSVKSQQLHLNTTNFDHDKATLTAVAHFKRRFVASIKIPRILCGQNNWIELYNELNWAYYEFEKNATSLGFLSAILATFVENNPDLVSSHSLGETTPMDFHSSSGIPNMRPIKPCNRPLRSRTLIVSDDKFMARKLSYILTAMIPSTINDKINQWDQQNQSQDLNQSQIPLTTSVQSNRNRSLSPALGSYHTELSRFGSRSYQSLQQQFVYSPRMDSDDLDSVEDDEECKSLATSFNSITTAPSTKGWEIPKRSVVSKTCESLIYALPQVIRPSMSSFGRSGSNCNYNYNYNSRQNNGAGPGPSLSLASSASATSFNSAKAINIHKYPTSVAASSTSVNECNPSSLSNSLKFSSSLTNSFKRSVGSASSSSISSLWSNMFHSGLPNNESNNDGSLSHIDTLSSRGYSDDKYNWDDYYNDLLPYNNGFSTTAAASTINDSKKARASTTSLNTEVPTPTTTASSTPITTRVALSNSSHKANRNITRLSTMPPTRPQWDRANSGERTPTTVYPCTNSLVLDDNKIDQGEVLVGDMPGYLQNGCGYADHKSVNVGDIHLNTTNARHFPTCDGDSDAAALVPSSLLHNLSSSSSSSSSSPLASPPVSASFSGIPAIGTASYTGPGSGVNIKDLDIRLSTAPGYSILDIPFVPLGDPLVSSGLPPLERRNKSPNSSSGQVNIPSINNGGGVLNVGSYSSRNPNFHHRHIGLVKQYSNTTSIGGTQRRNSPSPSRSLSPSPSTSFNNKNMVTVDGRPRGTSSNVKRISNPAPPLSSMNPIVLPPIVGFIGGEFHPDFYLQSISGGKHENLNNGNDTGEGNNEDNNEDDGENENNNEIDQKVIKLLLKESRLIMNAGCVAASKVAILQHFISHEISRDKQVTSARNSRRLRRMGSSPANGLGTTNNCISHDDTKSLQIPASIEAQEFRDFEQQVKQRAVIERDDSRELNRSLVIDLNRREIYYWIIVSKRALDGDELSSSDEDEIVNGKTGDDQASSGFDTPFKLQIYKHNIYQHGRLSEVKKVHQPEFVGVRWALKTIVNDLEDSDSDSDNTPVDTSFKSSRPFCADTNASDADSDTDSNYGSNGTELDPRMIKKLFENLIKLAQPCRAFYSQ